MLQKGALLAQSPTDFDHIDLMDATDKDNIRYEHANKSVPSRAAELCVAR